MADHKAIIVPYEPAHGEAMAANMRAIDRREVYYASLLSPRVAVAASVSISVGTWTGLLDGEVASIFGVARRSKLSDVGVPWLLSTPLIEAAPVTVARQSLVYFERMCRAFPVMENNVLAENTRAIVWLKWMGFDMEEARPWGPFGQPFIRFGKGLAKCA